MGVCGLPWMRLCGELWAARRLAELLGGGCLGFSDIVSGLGVDAGVVRRVARWLVLAGVLVRRGRAYCLGDGVLVDRLLSARGLRLYWAGRPPATRVLGELWGRVPLLLSAGLYWSSGGFNLAAASAAAAVASELFVDSGAQQFYRRFRGAEYPYGPREYLGFAAALGADYAATLDLPLDILVPRGSLGVWEGVRRTVEYGVGVYAAWEDMGLEDLVIVPVLQGYDDPAQWLECLDQYREHGVESRVWGVGSLCMTRSPRLALRVLSALRRRLGDSALLHVFGLGLGVLRSVFWLIDSFDTAAWVYWAKIDGAVLVWDPVESSFIHLTARRGYRYDTVRLMRANALQVKAMVDYVNNCLADPMQIYSAPTRTGPDGSKPPRSLGPRRPRAHRAPR